MDWNEWIGDPRFSGAMRCVLVLAVGLPVLALLSRLLGEFVHKRYTAQSAMLARKGLFYTGLALIVVIELHQLGFEITALLGAAGVFGVAVGFASQTSLSNLISGIFLIFEKPFQVGDVIVVDSTTGTVMSIDLLSVKLQQFDNKYVRIPNEKIIKGEVTNITHFPIRRFDINLRLSYREDIALVTAVLKEVVAKNAYCLDEPEPLITITAFGEYALEFLVGVWFLRQDLRPMRQSLLTEIKSRFQVEGIEFAFPIRVVKDGSTTTAFPAQGSDGK